MGPRRNLSEMRRTRSNQIVALPHRRTWPAEWCTRARADLALSHSRSAVSASSKPRNCLREALLAELSRNAAGVVAKERNGQIFYLRRLATKRKSTSNKVTCIKLLTE